jgi:hypothetical protein
MKPGRQWLCAALLVSVRFDRQQFGQIAAAQAIIQLVAAIWSPASG